jgi:branched-chain amino acid transport system substrate-binding protein
MQDKPILAIGEKKMSRKIFAILSLLLIASLMLAACAPQPAATEPPPAATEAMPEATEAMPEATEAMPEATEPPAAAFECTDALRCIDIAPGDPIKLAWAVVVEGPDASLGIDVRRGVEIAVDDKGGMLLDHPIELVGENTGCNAEGGQAAATKLAADTSIVGVVGTSCSSEARPGAPIITAAGLSMISASNTAPDLTDPATHVDGYFRTAHNDLVQGAVAAEFAYNFLEARTAATIHDGSLYADQLQQVFATRFAELGGEIILQGAVQPTDTDMRPVLTQIAATPPDILYYPIFVAAGGFVTAQARENAALADTALMGSDGIFSPDFITAAGQDVQGMYLSSPDFSAFGSAYEEFLTKHQAKYGEPPLSAFHAHGYDAANIFFTAIEQVAVVDADGTVHVPLGALRAAIAATSGFQGLTGSLTCTPTGDCADPKIAVYEVVNSDPASWNPGAADDSNPKKIYP